jgi:hypothetical protein
MSCKLGIAKIALAFGLLLFTSGAQAGGKLAFVDKFIDGSNELDVATYFDPGDASKASEKVAVLGIRNDTRRISISFGASEWHALVVLWAKAVAEQSNSWQDAGIYTETGTDDISTLKLSAGNGVIFLISSPAKGVETYRLSATDMGRFGVAVQNVQDSLANQTGE